MHRGQVDSSLQGLKDLSFKKRFKQEGGKSEMYFFERTDAACFWYNVPYTVQWRIPFYSLLGHCLSTIIYVYKSSNKYNWILSSASLSTRGLCVQSLVGRPCRKLRSHIWLVGELRNSIDFYEIWRHIPWHDGGCGKTPVKHSLTFAKLRVLTLITKLRTLLTSSSECVVLNHMKTN